MNDQSFTKTGALRRLRTLARDARNLAGIPRNTRTEVGLRTSPLVVPAIEEGTVLYADDDDLQDWVGLSEAAADPQVAAHGALVHIYFTGHRDELTIVIGWMGTPTASPYLCDIDGSRRF